MGEIAGLAIDDSGQSLTVVRGVRRRYSFTVDGPDRVGAEDVPVEVTGIVLGVRYLYSVLVEGSTVKSRTIVRPSRNTDVAKVDLEWCCLREHVPADAPALIISAAERHLPEALPRRFGEYEPFQGKYSEAGMEGFGQAWREATSWLFFSGSGLCLGGALSGGPGEQYPDRYWSMSLTLLADPLREAPWRDAVRDLFTTLADTLGAFYASAECIRDSTEIALCTLRFPEGWLGLRPAPTWWSWFGSPYASVADLLPATGRRPTVNGVLFEATTEPRPRDQTEPLSRWLPANLFARIGPKPGHVQPLPLIRAAVVPDELS
ncbi:hypothetical protein ABJI51_02580 [Amycolatopsis sp. NEAU-NG30]|uniref:Uncharacterized protein n=1 Tax=Amycolatopsis melonis TaxID=3156488 RepID=A0ABV0L6K2_9PSEU